MAKKGPRLKLRGAWVKCIRSPKALKKGIRIRSCRNTECSLWKSKTEDITECWKTDDPLCGKSPALFADNTGDDLVQSWVSWIMVYRLGLPQP